MAVSRNFRNSSAGSGEGVWGGAALGSAVVSAVSAAPDWPTASRPVSKDGMPHKRMHSYSLRYTNDSYIGRRKGEQRKQERLDTDMQRA
eukprot:835115-Prorocentrum_minimum.AAC.1